MHKHAALVLLAMVAAAGTWAGCGGTNGATIADAGARGIDATSTDDAGLPSRDDGATGGGGPAGPLTPGVFAGVGGGPASCLGLGGGCTTASDCCSGDCTGNACRYPSCASDQGPCVSDGDCCSQSCVGGTCSALNTTCKTLGNTCGSGGECCSSLCAGGSCQASSFCGQAGDACATGADCCVGTCAIAAGARLGTCGASPPNGPANCGVVDGQLCGGSTASGGVVFNDAGLPACGGPCCSRACAPWGPTGTLVCQPASGCHVVGDLCTKDADCCGSDGLPGGSGKPVTCDIAPSALLGICRNPTGCKPDGDVCKLQTMSCNASCDCCSGNCETEDTCKQDNMGVPRCAAAQCAAAGSACASSANCCNGSPCVPNAVDGGSPRYVCSGSSCVTACGQCTDNADCCPGTSCVLVPGTAGGICGPCGPPAAGPDAGPAPGGPDAGQPAPSCALFGQVCTTDSDCCDGLPCGGRCGVAVPR